MSSCSSDSDDPGRLGSRGDRDPHDHLVGVAERDRQDRVQLLLLLDEPHHLLGGVAEVLGRLRQVQQAAQRRRVDAVVAGSEHPELEAVLHLVEAVLELAHLGGQALVAQHSAE